MKQVALITTKQNYVWQSMQEVIPAIEKCWVDSAEITRIINVDVDPLRMHVEFLMKCEALIIIAFNETISRFIVNIRKKLKLDIPMVLHLYGHATIACWPEYRFGALECFNKGDAFIGTCNGDLMCMEKTFLNAKTYNIPYPYFSIDQKFNQVNGEKVFAYVGRISDQKNVHLLLMAYKEFLKISGQDISFYIYGKEDFLGSPNMGIASTEYLSDLKKLIKRLDIEKYVHFKGFQTREQIYQVLGKDHIFISASTHSDENFGMAAMRSLAVGGKAVLSNWGGHKEFKHHHPDRVWTSGVYFENGHPVIDPSSFAISMKDVLNTQVAISDQLISEYFLPNSIISSFEKVLAGLYFSTDKLILSDLALEAYGQQTFFESQGNIQKIFKNYNDPIAQAYLSSYQ